MQKPHLEIPAGLEAASAAIHAMLEPCFALRVSEPGEPSAPAGSRLFGSPFLPHLGDWPRTPEGRPMLFVGQIRLDDVAGSGSGLARTLPERGLLSFFYDLDVMPRGDEAEDRYRFRLLHFPGTPRGAPAPPPRGAPLVADPGRGLRIVPAWRLPLEVDRGYLLGDLDEEHYRRYSGLVGDLSEPDEHRLLGPGVWIEADPRPGLEALEAAESSRPPSAWRLLWQIAGEPGLSEARGDDVSIYVLIREDDLAEARFERARAIVQGGC